MTTTSTVTKKSNRICLSSLIKAKMGDIEQPTIRRRSKLFGTVTPNTSQSNHPSDNDYPRALAKEINGWNSLLVNRHKSVKQMKNEQKEIDTSILSDWQKEYLAKGYKIQDALLETNDFVTRAQQLIEQKTYLKEQMNYINEETNSKLTNAALDLLENN